MLKPSRYIVSEKNRNGELIYGYKCYNQLNNGTKTTRQQAGVDDSGFCDLKEICDWKLEMMARRIFSGLWGNKKDILNKVSSLYQVGVFKEYREAETVKDRVTEQHLTGKNGTECSGKINGTT